MQLDTIHFRGYTCFQNEWAGFDSIKPINVIIGRNNSGKSQLLDLVELICDEELGSSEHEVRVTAVLDEEKLRTVFSVKSNFGELPRNHWNNHGVHFVGAPIEWQLGNRGEVLNLRIRNEFRPRITYGEDVENKRLATIKQILPDLEHRLSNTVYRRLLADRDIAIEGEGTNLDLMPNGAGATNIIRRFILSSSAELPRDVIQKDLLDSLNVIFQTDGQFAEIQIQVHDDGSSDSRHINGWEVYLGEERKGLIPLSKSGSGLKTVLLVLLNLLAVPVIEKKAKSQYTFAFEELENNLHPALLRRLLRYLEDYAVEHDCTIFLTTHSSTALDVFSVSRNAQIIHVLHDGATAKTNTIAAHFDQMRVVSELGAKPSDLLQANGVIWVEGPTDRLYLNRWIQLYSDGRLQEGRDYQCAFFGGSLLARSRFGPPGQGQDSNLANLLRVNPNIVVVCDSDRTAKGSHIKGHVRRIRLEVRNIPGAHIWITAAKEIENYIPGAVLQRALGLSSLPDPEQYRNFFPRKGARIKSYVNAHTSRRNIDKMDLAISSIPHMTKDGMSNRFDWKSEVRKIVDRIESWNR